MLEPRVKRRQLAYQEYPGSVHEVFRGKTVWQGDVEVFDLHNHPKAKCCYAWSHLDGNNNERERFVAVLEIPPVVPAETAVRVQIVKDVRKGKE